MRSWNQCLVAVLLLAACKAVPVVTEFTPDPVVPVVELAGPEQFAAIENPSARAKALFVEAGKVLKSPRCTNCHPADDSPRQGDLSKLHEPPVTRGADGHGVFTNACHSCHQDFNNPDAPVPGAPQWHLAPKTMAWRGVTLAQLCAQLKNPTLNGKRDLNAIIEHSSKDPLVGWAWAPGPGRTPAAGTQERFGALLAAWAAAGADCPD